jgi:trk system potassium uptake protein TrkH
MGIILLVLAILPRLKFGGSQLFYAESSGLEEEQIRPRIIDVAKRLWGIYVMLTFLEVVFLCLGGMSFYDSICHAFGTIATGGFSTHNHSVGAYSPYIQYVIMFFMFLSGVNFTVHYFSLKGRFKTVIHNEELRAYTLIIILAGITISAILISCKHLPIWVAIRHAFFQVISIITATGFATTDYITWPTQAWIILFFLMFIGACAGSTGGGIKVLRHVILFKKISKSINRLIHPNAVLPVKYNGITLAPELVNSILGFVTIYFTIFMLGTLIMSGIGMDLQTAMGSVITTMGGIGPGIGKVGPAANFAFIPTVGKLFLSLLMILGRLEIYSLLIIFTPAFWKV